MFRRFGSRVSIVERTPRLAGREDPDAAEAIEQILREDGIEVHTDATISRVNADPAGSVTVHVGSVHEIRGSHPLVATGRVPNSDLLEPTAAGLELDAGGYLVVDERLQTNVPGIYALGDIAGTPPFTHLAYDGFRILRANLLEGGDRTTEGRVLPYTVFIDP